MTHLKTFLGSLLLFVFAAIQAQPKTFDAPGTGNPILPGYFADPTVKQFGDYYFIYATTDGTGWGTGPSQVWYSKDFVNWTLTEMNWPTTEVYWAPDVWQEPDGKYYLYYSQPVQLHGGVANTPFGPWKELTDDGSPIVPDRFVKNVITLDGQTFLDDDGKRYLHWGTWGIYEGFGAGWGLMNPDRKSFADKGIIPNTQAKDFFEGPFMFKNNGKYYFTYSSGSCHDETYRVQYAISDLPTGPFIFPDNNPILATNSDGSVHGPGHHSILKQGDDYYIVYHRHDNPHSSNGFHRQIAADKLEFDEKGLIKKVVPTHEGIGFLAKNTNPFPNLLAQKSFKVSSEYGPDFHAKYALDENNGTLWMPAPNDEQPWIEVDLGSIQQVQRTRTSFHYATHYFQYLIEYSIDGKSWKIFADKRNNVQSGSPMSDYNDVQARYLRLTMTGVERQGFRKAVWEFKAFGGFAEDPEQELIHLEAADLEIGSQKWTNHAGMYGGEASNQSLALKKLETGDYASWKGVLSGLRTPLLTNAGMDYTAIITYLKNDQLAYAALQYDGVKKQFDSKLLSNVGAEAAVKRTLENLLKTGELLTSLSVQKIRVFNRRLHPDEVEFYALQAYESAQKPSELTLGLLVDFNAKDFEVGKKLNSFENQASSKGQFKALSEAPSIDILAGRKTLVFEKGQQLISDVPAPTTLGGNNPYTIMAWVYNPSLDPAESIFEWAPGGHQILTAGRFQVGNSREQGASFHTDWADMGYGDQAPTEGEWHHLALVFDGYMERTYVDGLETNAEQKWLFMQPGAQMVIGGSASGLAAFSGALSSLQVFDRSKSGEEIKSIYQREQNDSEILVALLPKDLKLGTSTNWVNQGILKGSLVSGEKPADVKVVDGQLAICTCKKGTLSWAGESTLNAPDYTLHLQLYEKDGWHVYSLVQKGAGRQTYKDGITTDLNALFSELGLWNLPDLSAFKLPKKRSMASLMITKGAASSEEVKAYLHSLKSSEKTKNAAFIITPKAISSVAAYMKALPMQGSASVAYGFVKDSQMVGDWQSSSEWLDHTLEAGKSYNYQFLIRDAFGHILQQSDAISVRTDGSTYTEQFFDFEQGLGDLKIYETSEERTGLVAAKTEDGTLYLSSKGSGWDGPMKRGAFAYLEVSGDFVAEVELTDYTGLDKKQGIRYNDPGLLLTTRESLDSANWDFVNLTFFPLYNQGNMITNRQGWRSEQVSNMTGWEAHRFLQLERKGSDIFLRTSTDGKNWVLMPGAPVSRPDFEGKTLLIGLSQVTHSDQEASAKFDHFRVSQIK